MAGEVRGTSSGSSLEAEPFGRGGIAGAVRPVPLAAFLAVPCPLCHSGAAWRWLPAAFRCFHRLVERDSLFPFTFRELYLPPHAASKVVCFLVEISRCYCTVFTVGGIFFFSWLRSHKLK